MWMNGFQGWDTCVPVSSQNAFLSEWWSKKAHKILGFVMRGAVNKFYCKKLKGVYIKEYI